MPRSTRATPEGRYSILRGRLVGVNTAGYSPSGASAGVGFSIPVDVVSGVVPELIEYGSIRRQVLGVELPVPELTRASVSPGRGSSKWFREPPPLGSASGGPRETVTDASRAAT